LPLSAATSHRKTTSSSFNWTKPSRSRRCWALALPLRWRRFDAA
jgi:hypothetical protein